MASCTSCIEALERRLDTGFEVTCLPVRDGDPRLRVGADLRVLAPPGLPETRRGARPDLDVRPGPRPALSRASSATASGMPRSLTRNVRRDVATLLDRCLCHPFSAIASCREGRNPSIPAYSSGPIGAFYWDCALDFAPCEELVRLPLPELTSASASALLAN